MEKGEKTEEYTTANKMNNLFETINILITLRNLRILNIYSNNNKRDATKSYSKITFIVHQTNA